MVPERRREWRAASWRSDAFRFREPRLSRSEIVLCPAKDICEIELSRRGEANAPSWLGHAASRRPAGYELLGEIVQIGLELLHAVELLEFASIELVQARTNRFPQGFQLCGILGLSLLYEAQAFAQHLARVLVTAGADERVDELLLTFRQHDVPRRHWQAL